MPGRELQLCPGPQQFRGVTVDWRSRELALVWVADVGLANIVGARLVTFRLGIPPLRVRRVFIPLDH